jgi:ribosomal-protein-alanine N-acetyltransferase
VGAEEGVMVLKTRRLVVRPYKVSDFPVWLAAQRKVEPKKNRFDRGPLSPVRLNRRWFFKMIKGRQKLAKRDIVYLFAIFHRKTGEHVGHIDLLVKTRLKTQDAILGYAIHNFEWEEWGYRNAPKIRRDLKDLL